MLGENQLRKFFINKLFMFFSRQIKAKRFGLKVSLNLKLRKKYFAGAILRVKCVANSTDVSLVTEMASTLLYPQTVRKYFFTNDEDSKYEDGKSFQIQKILVSLGYAHVRYLTIKYLGNYRYNVPRRRFIHRLLIFYKRQSVDTTAGRGSRH